mgnify:CR=1 FL=1
MDRRILQQMEHFYKEDKFNGMGIVLNGTDIKHRYGYSYGYGYGYGYGEDTTDDSDADNEEKAEKK